jgi:hypothetical protein
VFQEIVSIKQYSPERRTALVLCGTGVHGAYHAGVLRALQEAGVKIDIIAGQGIGAGAAAIAAIDGAARLHDADGIWRSGAATRLYGWTWPVRAAAWIVALLAAVLVMLATAGDYVALPARRGAIVVWALVAVAWCAAVIVRRRWRAPARRRTDGGWLWSVVGAPVDAESARDLFTRTLWELIRGAAPAERAPAAVMARRYSDVLAESLGQPGFRELMLIASDLDARRDVIAALVREPFRREFIAPRPGRERRSEVLDLAGAGREHALDLLGAALTPPIGADPQLVTFAADSYWRGETHRMCDRPGAVVRLLEELAAAGASQVIIVSAVASGSKPHHLSAARLDFRHRLGEALAAAEAASLRDALELARVRFDSWFLICPAHNPVGAFDLTGAYDEASDRRQDVPELMERAYEDAYRQFIEPVVGASGEHLASGLRQS